MKSGAALPGSTTAAGLTRAQAAAYVAISPSLFDRAVRDGLMPPARLCYGRCVWDRKEVEQFFSLWPHKASGPDSAPDDTENPWD
jgi:hypothetical protein